MCSLENFSTTTVYKIWHTKKGAQHVTDSINCILLNIKSMEWELKKTAEKTKKKNALQIC